MKKLTGALVLSFSLLLITGCRSSGETRDAGDASTPSGLEQGPSHSRSLDEAKEVLRRNEAGDSGTPGAAQDTPQGGGTGTTGQAIAQGTTPSGGSTTATLTDAERKAQESCLDKWLKDKKLDRYGSPEGTMYAGGTPLFDERTGESRDRLDFVYQRQPEARKACASQTK